MNYIEVLENYRLPWAPLTHRENWIFQQDNTSIHTASIMQKYKFMLWLAHSPDLKIIEDLWKIVD